MMHPDSIKKWTMDQVMKWILNLYHSNSYRLEDVNLPVLKDITGKDLLNFNELNCQEIDHKKSKWLYEQVQGLVRRCGSLERKLLRIARRFYTKKNCYSNTFANYYFSKYLINKIAYYCNI